jgi:hypothetical protein
MPLLLRVDVIIQTLFASCWNTCLPRLAAAGDGRLSWKLRALVVSRRSSCSLIAGLMCMQWNPKRTIPRSIEPPTTCVTKPINSWSSMVPTKRRNHCPLCIWTKFGMGVHLRRDNSWTCASPSKTIKDTILTIERLGDKQTFIHASVALLRRRHSHVGCIQFLGRDLVASYLGNGLCLEWKLGWLLRIQVLVWVNNIRRNKTSLVDAHGRILGQHIE